MIPFKDDNPVSTIPFVTVAIIVINVIVFLIELLDPEGPQSLIIAYGVSPSALLTFKSTPVFHVFTSMFLHGGFLHIAGNMLYFWIFGNNIEDQMGHFRFLLFYLICGFVAALSYAVSNPASAIPMVGASGAIAGILGAYLLLYPNAKIHTIIFFGFFIDIILLPAIVVIGFWAVLQVLSGFLSKGAAGQGGIAWFAHVGGFLFGILTVKIWVPKRRRYWK